MRRALEKWQATVVILTIVAAAWHLTLEGRVDGDVAIAGLFGIAGALLGGGAVAHGVTQGSKATHDPPPEG